LLTAWVSTPMRRLPARAVDSAESSAERQAGAAAATPPSPALSRAARPAPLSKPASPAQVFRFGPRSVPACSRAAMPWRLSASSPHRSPSMCRWPGTPRRSRSPS
jgi:hypothetical protein